MCGSRSRSPRPLCEAWGNGACNMRTGMGTGIRADMRKACATHRWKALVEVLTATDTPILRRPVLAEQLTRSRKKNQFCAAAQAEAQDRCARHGAALVARPQDGAPILHRHRRAPIPHRHRRAPIAHRHRRAPIPHRHRCALMLRRHRRAAILHRHHRRRNPGVVPVPPFRPPRGEPSNGVGAHDQQMSVPMSSTETSVVGYNCAAVGRNSAAVGRNSGAVGRNSAAVGHSSAAVGCNSAVVGCDSAAVGDCSRDRRPRHCSARAAPHHTARRCTSRHRTAPRRTAPHRTAPHRISLHLTVPHLTSPHGTEPATAPCDSGARAQAHAGGRLCTCFCARRATRTCARTCTHTQTV